MDKIQKFIRKLSGKERKEIENLISLIIINNFAGLDIKKLKGSGDCYRVRKRNVRIIFRLNKNGDNEIIKVCNRDDQTYNF